ncbi:MAG: carbohydrate ABC transporter permease [Defluviitaleaceae bacterium]|nr:carbohydrate ABC transporter permease [Defluviitaleaceae bacterium]
MTSNIPSVVKKGKRINSINFLSELVMHLILGGFALLCVIPFAFIIIISFSSADSLTTMGYSFTPIGWSLLAYQAAFDLGAELWRSYFNSFFVTIIGTLLSVIICTMYAYGLYRRDYPLAKFFAFIAFFTMIFGGGLAPTVMVIRNLLGLADSYWALIVPLLVSPFNFFLMRTFLKVSVPESLIESARLDGSGEFRTLISIVVPLAKPGIATISLLTALAYWNDWFNALLFIRNSQLYPLQYLLMQMQTNVDFIRRNVALLGAAANIDFSQLPSEGLRMALCVLVVLPIAFAYPFFQRFIVAGLAVGAVKE